MNDLKFALRQLLKAPAFTAVAVLSLALGIGANATVFCWIQEVLLHPLPGVAQSNRMVVLCSARGPNTWETASLPDIRDYRKLTNIFAGIIGSQITPACLTVDGRPEWIYGQIATANFFDVLGVKALLGRTFVAEEDQRPGGAPVLVLSEGYWQRRFGGDPSVIGRTVDLNRQPFTIIGVVPGAFRGTMSALRCDYWAPLVMHQQVANFGSLTERGDRWLHTQARLQPGVNPTAAQSAVDTMAAHLATAYPKSNGEIGLRVLPVWRAPYGGQAMLRPVLGVLLAVSLGVLLIVAINLANLLLARATIRQKEIAIRLALGAGRARLIRQLLTESLLLAGVGGLLGVVLAGWGATLFKLFLPPTYLPIGYEFRVDGGTLLFTLGLTLATGFLFGLVPALQSSRPGLNTTLKEGGRTSGVALPHHRLRSGLVVAETALALMLLVSAGLCIQGSHQASQLDVGFNPRPVLLAGLRVGMHGYTEARALGFYRQLRQRLAGLPGVREASLASWFPLGFEGGSSTSVQVPGYDQKASEDMGVPYSIIAPRYFAALGIRLLAGRDFTDQDDDAQARVAIINETMAKRFWPGQDPVGRKFSIWGGSRELTVVGVARDGKYRFLDEPPKSWVYFAYQQGSADMNLGVALRTDGNPVTFANTLRAEIRALDPGVEVWTVIPMADYVQAAFMPQRIVSTLLVALGFVALVLAAMGIYGVMAYVVSQRTHELGVRMALGAQAGDVLRLVLGQGMRLAASGTVVGLAGALALARLLTNFLHGVSPFDPATFVVVALGLTIVTLLACMLPAWRATRVDPCEALRYE